MKKLISIIIFLNTLFSCSEKKQDLPTLWTQYTKSKSLDKAVCREILEHYSQSGLLKERDSAMKIFLIKASWENNVELENDLYTAYFDRHNFADPENAFKLNEQWIEKVKKSNNSKWLFHAFKSEYQFLRDFGEIKKANGSAQKAAYHANICGEKPLLIESLLMSGECLQQNNQKVSAFQNYLDALYIAREVEAKDLIQKSLYSIADLYMSIEEYAKAAESLKDEIKLYTECNEQIDSTEFINLLCIYSDALINSDDTIKANVYSKQVIDYASRRNDRELMNHEFTILRSYYTVKNYPEEMKKLYFQDYPEELDSLKADNPLKYYRTLTFIYDGSGNGDSALHYMALSDSAVNMGGYEPSVLSNYYSRCGTLYLKYGQIDKAEKAFLNSYQYADSIQHFPFLKYAALMLDTIYTLKSNYQEAHRYSEKAITYLDLIKETDENPEFIKMSFQNSERERDLKTTQEKKETDRKHNLQYMIIVFVILISFLLLTVAVSFKIPRYVIKVYGFFFFIMLFEFIILLADHQIHELTHGAPLWILAIKILLIAILMPLHHWSEEKIVHYFLHHRVVDNFSLKDKWQLLKQRFRTETENPEEDAPHS